MVWSWDTKKLNILPKVTELMVESELDLRKPASKAYIWTSVLYHICFNESCHNVEVMSHGLYNRDLSFCTTWFIIYPQQFSTTEMLRHKDIKIGFVYSTSQLMNQQTTHIYLICSFKNWTCFQGLVNSPTIWRRVLVWGVVKDYLGEVMMGHDGERHRLSS